MQNQILQLEMKFRIIRNAVKVWIKCWHRSKFSKGNTLCLKNLKKTFKINSHEYLESQPRYPTKGQSDLHSEQNNILKTKKTSSTKEAQSQIQNHKTQKHPHMNLNPFTLNFQNLTFKLKRTSAEELIISINLVFKFKFVSQYQLLNIFFINASMRF